jgi:hypothetical protein
MVGVGIWEWSIGDRIAYSYTVKLVSNSSVVSGYTTSGTNPTVFTGLAASTAYNVTVTANNPLGSVLGTIASISTIPATKFTINSVTFNSSAITAGSSLNSGNGYITGQVTSNSTLYNVYAFGQTSAAYQINITCNTSSTIYYLCVGGGGGGSDCGGGAGGVYYGSCTVPTGTDTITINVGAGGLGKYGASTGASNSVAGLVGGDSKISWTTNTSLNAYAGGGGGGAGANGVASSPSSNGGSGGGANYPSTSMNAVTTNTLGQSINAKNGGGYQTGVGYYGLSGGGAGTGGNNGWAGNWNAGNGIQIPSTIYGIYNFAPSGYSQFSAYWWGGGGATGGAGGVSNSSAIPGKGGGGSVSSASVDSNGIYPSSNGTTSPAVAGNGGANTGGGGGGIGGWSTGTGGNGGSGIVVIAMPN